MSMTVARVPAPPRRDHAERDVAGAAGDVEQRETARLAALRRIDRRDQRVLPGAMQPARHQVVHQVVAPRHAVEHVVDQRLLVAERHLPEAEMGVSPARGMANNPLPAGP